MRSWRGSSRADARRNEDEIGWKKDNTTMLLMISNRFQGLKPQKNAKSIANIGHRTSIIHFLLNYPMSIRI